MAPARKFLPSLAVLLFLASAGAPATAYAQGASGTPEAASEPPRAEEIQLGISADVIPLHSDFSGTEIAVFGTIENADRIAQVLNEYAIVVVVRGPLQDLVVRRKERVFGIWINRASRIYRKVPSFYALSANRDLSAVAAPEILREYELGIDNIKLNLYSAGAETFITPEPEFSAALRRIRQGRELFTEDVKSVDLLGSTLFRATLALPSDVPIGRHTVTAYLFRSGQFLTSRTDTFLVEKAGLEKLLYTLAHAYSVWYGLMAVGIALATGWLASLLFGANRK